MDFDKDKIGKQLTVRLAEALKKGEVKLEEASKASSFILDNIDKITIHDKLVDFLNRLNSKWPVFSQILTIEKGKIVEKQEKAVSEQASELLKEKKIDEVINKVKQTTETNISKEEK